MTDWSKLAYTALIVIIYLPMVFMGTNVFFPKYQDRYDMPRASCWTAYPAPVEGLSAEEQAARDKARFDCEDKNREADKAWQDAKRQYDGWKFVFIAAFNLLIMLFLLWLPHLEETIAMGLFIGAALATAFATMIYQETRSKPGFAILLATFILVLAFIHSRRGKGISLRARKRA